MLVDSAEVCKISDFGLSRETEENVYNVKTVSYKHVTPHTMCMYVCADVYALHWTLSLLQRWICTQLYVVGTADSVVIREVYFTQCPL